MLLVQGHISCYGLCYAGVSISFIISGWFYEVGGCGKEGAVRRFPCGGLEGILPQKTVKIGVIYPNNRRQ